MSVGPDNPPETVWPSPLPAARSIGEERRAEVLRAELRIRLSRSKSEADSDLVGDTREALLALGPMDHPNRGRWSSGKKWEAVLRGEHIAAVSGQIG